MKMRFYYYNIVGIKNQGGERVKGLEQLHKRHRSLPEFYNHFGAMAFCKQNAVRFVATNYQHQ